MKVIQKHVSVITFIQVRRVYVQKHVVPDEGYYRNTWKVITETRVPNEGYYRNTSYLMKVITETRRTWWRLLQKHVVPDEGYYRNTSYLMKVITETRRTWWRL